MKITLACTLLSGKQSVIEKMIFLARFQKAKRPVMVGK